MATPAVAGGAALRAQTVSLSSPEYQILVAQNNERSRSGAAPLAVDPLLETLARQRANDMANSGYFSHGTPNGSSIFSMLAAAGPASRLEAENIARNDYPESQTATIAMNGFLGSSGHRDNLLNPGFTRVGIGAARRGTMTYFAVSFSGP